MIQHVIGNENISSISLQNLNKRFYATGMYGKLLNACADIPCKAEENQKLQTELSRTQNISQSLQRSNDDLRNRNGLLSRREQEQLEEKIKDVQARNSKLEKMVV